MKLSKEYASLIKTLKIKKAKKLETIMSQEELIQGIEQIMNQGGISKGIHTLNRLGIKLNEEYIEKLYTQLLKNDKRSKANIIAEYHKQNYQQI